MKVVILCGGKGTRLREETEFRPKPMQDPMKNLAADRELNAYLHKGFWQPMDTYQEFLLLNRMWEAGHAPWKIWNRVEPFRVRDQELQVASG